MMKKIKFSHLYEKFNHTCEGVPNPPEYAVLLEVFLVDDVEDLHPRFVEYDTLYFDKNPDQRRWVHYKLPAGKVLVLLFRSDCFLFTTIRRYTPRKYEYYMGCRGEEFEIVFEGV